MKPNEEKVFRTLNIRRVWLPVIIGIGIVVYLLASDDHFELTHLYLIQQARWRYILLAFLVVTIRDLGYMYRIRSLTDKDLSWQRSFYIIVLWEFSSAVTPFVVGGGIVAIFLLLKEGIGLGRALAYVIITSIFDNLFFIGAATLGFWGVYEPIFASIAGLRVNMAGSLKLLFWFSYAIVLTYTLIMLGALFSRPQFFKWALLKITSIGFLRRWRKAARIQGDELILASKVLQGKRFTYWLQVGCVTLVTWGARYLVVNMIMAAYVNLNFTDHLMILGKQIIMWTVMLFTPTPGGSGMAEFFYKQLYEAMLGDYVLVTNVLWRLLTYYIYLVLGAIYLPRWVKRVFARRS
ncbi:MAG: lysylphosphatidylglycerol synthase transmembrane domain-containing protein [Bacteroidota bacterium]